MPMRAYNPLLEAANFDGKKIDDVDRGRSDSLWNLQCCWLRFERHFQRLSVGIRSVRQLSLRQVSFQTSKRLTTPLARKHCQQMAFKKE
jgi:hypothetical protein